MNEMKAGSKWWGYVSKRGTVRAKHYVEHSEAGRRTTKAFIEWCGDYIAANTEPFASGSKKDALAITHKLLAAKIAELKSLKTKK